MINLVDSLFYYLTAFTVVYLLIYAIAGLFRQKDDLMKVAVKHRFAIIIPAYRDDAYIIQTVQSILLQEYPEDCYEVIVIADQLKDETLLELTQLSITLVKANFTTHSKTKSIKAAISILPAKMYDLVLIINADNTIAPDLLDRVNNSYTNGSNAIQCHRIKKNPTTVITLLEAMTDEVENVIFREGHTTFNLSASLNGSGMAFDYNWFCENIEKLANNEDEKELESLLLKEKIYIDYLNKALVYSEKEDGKNRYIKQRINWVKMHYRSLFKNFSNLIPSLLRGNFDYFMHIIQWITIPRHLVLGVILLFGINICFFDWTLCFKWWGLFFAYIFTLAIALPDYLVNEKFDQTMRSHTILSIQLLLQLFNPMNRKIK